ncbi:TonB-dependent receptor [Persicobacter psychrovividus]|uniref:Collagen-binding protein n=1 Tax=Persicobacter psychrovividus TaxID=387638 RepID=A0ABN6L8D8_9BACT|nr:collagen-binding protein [Persicobacter psychrovividus]
MNPIKTLLLVLFLALGQAAFAQNFSVSGYLKDGKTGEELPFANVVVKGTTTGVTTNAYGFYTLTLPEGEYELNYQFLGYTTLTKKVSLNKNIKFTAELQPSTKTLEEVVIEGEAANANVVKNEMSVVALSPKSISTVPVLFGEKDILKTIQLMPGVSSTGEGNSGFYVRGGSADQNLIILDEAPVYNASHLLGFFSVFNSDAVKSLKLYKSGIPAQYGGRLSSVLDVKMDNGNDREFGGEGGIGLISSRLTLEGPIKKGKGSFIVSGRRTYADLFLKLSSNEGINQSKLYFYDLNAKANYRLGDNDRVFLSGYFGRDVFGNGDLFGLQWGNGTGTLRWNHLFSDRFFSNSSLIFSNYDYQIGVNSGSTPFTITSGIQDWNFKQDFDYSFANNNLLKFGFNIIHHTFQPGKLAPKEGNFSFNPITVPGREALETGTYVTFEQKLGARLQLNYGLRVSTFSNIGGMTEYQFAPGGETPTDSVTYGNGELYNTQVGIEPRFNANFVIDEQSSVKASYARTYQYLHLLSNSTAGSPTDVWVPTTPIIKPEYADQVALGYFRNFEENKYESSVEVYYKKLYNQIDYKNGAEILLNPFLESQLVFGKGYAYGMELFLKKKYGRFNGWIGYTLSTTRREFKEINDGKPFSARQDRRHDISIVGMYKLNDRWDLSATWVYNTGDAVTFPSGSYVIEDKQVPLYTERNGYRMPSYHRMDFGATFHGKKHEHFESSWNFSVYNLYARYNAYFIRFEDNEQNPEVSDVIQTSLFSLVPAVTYNFKF